MPVAGASSWFAEAVWNKYNVQPDSSDPSKSKIDPGYNQNNASAGGVDYTKATPWYQSALLPFNPPTTSDKSNKAGRGVPDVSALSSGNMEYNVPDADLKTIHGDGGTSAATPFWASLAVQMNAILHDQGLPYDLGYMNDLLYIAMVIQPASFNDVTLGNNNSSYLLGPNDSAYRTAKGKKDSTLEGVTPTDFGYSAIAGYDLASGLGSPNGIVLTETMSAITFSQLYYVKVPGVLSSDGTSSTVKQSLLIQGKSDSAMSVAFKAGSSSRTFSTITSTFGWTSRLAGQSLQNYFDDDLVRLFDKDGQGTVMQTTLGAGDSLSIALNGSTATAYSLDMTNPFGFADFQTPDGTVRVARPLAVAAMAPGLSEAVARIRQNGTDSLSVMFYQVDDYAGSIAGLQAGDAGYDLAARARAYQMNPNNGNQLSNNNTLLGGPGFGNFTEALIEGVSGGDLVAMELFDNSRNTHFWAFNQGNELSNGQGLVHLWNYGLNTWGWEDTLGGGDRDYNDLVVGLDFTAAAGRGILK
jgi:hypothetical protein